MPITRQDGLPELKVTITATFKPSDFAEAGRYEAIIKDTVSHLETEFSEVDYEIKERRHYSTHKNPNSGGTLPLD